MKYVLAFTFLLLVVTTKGISAFDFVEMNIREDVLHFSTVEEGEHYPFYIEQWINNEWTVVAEVYGKGGIDTNSYEVPLNTIFYGINKYRVKKETGWDYYSFSNPLSYFYKNDKVLPFVKEGEILFSDTAFYKIVTDEGHIVDKGRSYKCEVYSLEKGKYIFMYNNRKKRLIVRRRKIILKDQL